MTDVISPAENYAAFSADSHADSHALCGADVLSLLIPYLEAQQHLFIALVHSVWRSSYQTLTQASLKSLHPRKKAGELSRMARVTAIRQAVSSISRLQMAIACGLQLALRDSDRRSVVSEVAGAYADRDTLMWAKMNGLPWGYWVTSGAARRNRTDLLNWLYAEQECAVLPINIVTAAATHGHAAPLQWLCFGRARPVHEKRTSVRCSKTKKTLDAQAVDTELLKVAAEVAANAGQVELLRWLLEQRHVELQLFDFLTLCMSALHYGQVAVFRFLLQLSPSPLIDQF